MTKRRTASKESYPMFDKAFAKVSGYAVLKGEKYVGRVCIKYPQDGAGRVAAFVQVWGYSMGHGYAGGYGYDRASAAVEDAIADMMLKAKETVTNNDSYNVQFLNDLSTVANMDTGYRWSARLEMMGYTVLSVFA